MALLLLEEEEAAFFDLSTGWLASLSRSSRSSALEQEAPPPTKAVSMRPLRLRLRCILPFFVWVQVDAEMGRKDFPPFVGYLPIFLSSFSFAIGRKASGKEGGEG